MRQFNYIAGIDDRYFEEDEDKNTELTYEVSGGPEQIQLPILDNGVGGLAIVQLPTLDDGDGQIPVLQAPGVAKDPDLILDNGIGGPAIMQLPVLDDGVGGPAIVQLPILDDGDGQIPVLQAPGVAKDPDLILDNGVGGPAIVQLPTLDDGDGQIPVLQAPKEDGKPDLTYEVSGGPEPLELPSASGEAELYEDSFYPALPESIESLDLGPRIYRVDPETGETYETYGDNTIDYVVFSPLDDILSTLVEDNSSVTDASEVKLSFEVTNWPEPINLDTGSQNELPVQTNVETLI